MVFGRKLVPRCALRIATRLEGKIAEKDSFKSKEFLIISRKTSIFSLCFACIVSIAAITANVTALAIDCLIAEFMEL